MTSVSKCRLEWSDADWAKYLNCSVAEITKYKKFLFKEYEVGIGKVRESGKYRFEMYKYHISPSGFRMPVLIYSGNREFGSVDEAIKNANEIISGDNFVLTDFWAKIYDMPKQAIQMLLINKNQRRK